MSALELQAICKTYDGHQAVAALDLTVAKGKVCGLLGPNGAGKTTAIRMMMGIILPDSGRCVCSESRIIPDSGSAWDTCPRSGACIPR